MFTTIIQPRVSETDGAGHINNTTLPVWFEAGREEIFKLFTPDCSFENWKMVIVKMEVEFVDQIYYGEKVEVRTWVENVKNTSLVIYEELYQGERLCSKGAAVYVNFNFQLQKTEPIPISIRQELEKHRPTHVSL